jgi:hypothetical protein
MRDRLERQRDAESPFVRCEPAHAANTVASVRPNPPYLATIVAAIVLMVVGLSLEGSLFRVGELNSVVAQLLQPLAVAANRELGRILVVAAPALLIVASLVPGI